ncbi:MAG: NYN domain-containing protein [Euzebyaceae bacterium]|nr:NYN domain-containing protein [Euzebyaceae bacterium]
MRCRTCSKTWVSYEENETGVAIAANIVRDAARGSMDTAIVVSGDSDLLPALRAAKGHAAHHGRRSAFPPRRTSAELKRFATTSFTISRAKLRNAQFPQTVEGTKRTVQRPRALEIGQRLGVSGYSAPRRGAEHRLWSAQLPRLQDCRRHGQAQLDGLGRDCGGQALQRRNSPSWRLDAVALVTHRFQDGQQRAQRPLHQRGARCRLDQLGGQRTGRALQRHRDAVGGAQLRQMQGDRCGHLLGRRSRRIVVEQRAGHGGHGVLQRAQHLKGEWEGKRAVRRCTLDRQLQRAGLLLRDGGLQVGLAFTQRRAHKSQAGQLVGDGVLEGLQRLGNRRQLLV